LTAAGIAEPGGDEVVAERNRPLRQALREASVVIEGRRNLLQRAAEIRALRQFAVSQPVQCGQAGTGVRLGEHHVEAHRRHAVAIEQLVEQRAQDVAAPGPAAHAFQAGLVDIEDGDAVVRPGRGGALQPDVVQPGFGALERRQVEPPARVRRQQQDEQRGHTRLRQPRRGRPHRSR
jgi:hypothetical protein